MSVRVSRELVAVLRATEHEDLLDRITETADRYGANVKARHIDRVGLLHRFERVDRRGDGTLPEYVVRLLAEALYYAPSALGDLPEESLPLRRVRLMGVLIDRADLRPENRKATLRGHLAHLASEAA